MKIVQSWRQWARQLKTETYALYLAYRDQRTPWYAKLLIMAIVAYAFSPIDLIPDFIPVFGYLDDLIILPAAIALALKLIPAAVLAEHRAQARLLMAQAKPTHWLGGLMIILIWLLLAALIIIFISHII
jgi:uncharacterized membrane protein YkvA (DUF1232 family)